MVIDGFPPLRGATLARARAPTSPARHRRLATAIVDEPRGNEPMVGALLTEPVDDRCVTGVIFFDRALVLGMCGHGMIGLVETLRRLGRIGAGEHLVETPAGVVPVVLGEDGRVTVDNVVSRRLEHDVIASTCRRSGGSPATSSTAATCSSSSAPRRSTSTAPVRSCCGIAADVMRSVHAAGFVDVDHVELFGPPTTPAANSRNFVLCPSGTYDRSPCGTGTSAKVAALAADGPLDEGATWVQQSITGSTFTVRYRWHDRAAGAIVPTVSGSATVTGRAELFIAPDELGG